MRSTDDDADRHHLLPHLRERPPTRIGLRCEQARLAAEAILETGERLPSADAQLHDLERDRRAEFRAIPLLGATRVTAVIPGTMPGERV